MVKLILDVFMQGVGYNAIAQVSSVSLKYHLAQEILDIILLMCGFNLA